ncbi:unnamed protein product [Orchesella dallaii]|uniref:E3 SUMO-protein ligase RanBP2 n=1 Tax=Orchesella dallaii TaxID=48710 RepID=A0ABP1QTN3_9HEXA
MFRSKKDVDAHVRDVFTKCSSENERLKLCFAIAKQYARIKEFESAKRYLDTYLASNPTNSAEANKLMGDIHLELGESELALENYKVSYMEGNARDSLNRVCDLLTKGIGKQETPDSKKKWFDIQKSSQNNTLLTAHSTSTSMNSPVSKTAAQTNGGPPKSGFGHSFLNGSVGTLIPPSPKSNVGSVDLQLRYLERRFDDGIGKIVEQNNLFMDQMLKLKDEMKDLSTKVDQMKTNHLQVETVVSTITTQQTELTVAIKAIQTHQTDLLEAIKKIQIQPREEVDARNTITIRAIDESRESAVVKPTYQLPIEKIAPDAKQPPIMLSQVWKKPEGNWDCGACYVSNSKDITVCVACNTVRPGFETPVKVEPVEAMATKPSFSFGFPTANTTTPFQGFGMLNTLPGNSLELTPKPTLSALPVNMHDSTPKNTLPVNLLSSTPKKSDESKESPFTNLNLAGKFSFADLAKNNSGTPFSGDGNTFSGAGTPLFATSLNTATKSSNDKTANTSTHANTSGNADDGEDDFVPTAEFQPVIPLPPLVEVKKGDENENTIAEYRAKIYRFINEAKEWKERGVGNIKLLQSKAHPNKSRVVMWREKVGKLACNFSLFPDIKVTYYQGNLKVLCFKCQDFAEEPQWEMFTVRFASEENCKNFKEEMERLAILTITSPESTPTKADTSVKNTSFSSSDFANGNKLTEKPLSELFKKPEGNWDCGACYVSNIKDTTVCVACNTVRPGYEAPAISESVDIINPTKPAFSFGFPSANPVTPFQGFGVASTTPVNCNIDSTPKKSEENKDSAFTGLNLSGKFSFADLAKNNNASFSFGGDGNSFSGAGTPLFKTALTTPNKSADEKTGNETVASNTSRNAEDGDDDFVPTAEFQPVIPLPPLVEVKKGDENENTIAEYRAKLYRFVPEAKEWKERGIGNIKLLQSKSDPSKCRVVMWREKIGKLACNFSLFPDIKVTNYQGNPKVLCFKCQDFAEEPQWETFTVRFSSEENCKNFKEEMERLAKLTGEPNCNTTLGDTKETSHVSDVSGLPVSTTLNSNVTANKPLSELFKKPEGTWDCGACYVSNNKDTTTCVACSTVRPGYEATTTTKTDTTEVETKPSFSFGFPAANPTTPFQGFGLSTTLPANNTFDLTPKKSEENKDSPFTNLNLAGKFSFADLAKNNNPSFSFGGDGNTFNGAGAPLFATALNTVTKGSDEKGGTSTTHANTSGNADEPEDDFTPTAEFQPVIPLPPLVEVKKGDENENTIAEYRAKIYRFVSETKEWKERGVGNIKLLQSKSDLSKCRVVMWRDKIGKLACNFSLFPDIKITNYQGNPKVLCFRCQDFAEEPQWETFTCRFGNEDNCADFKNKMLQYAVSPPVSVTSSAAPDLSTCAGCIGCDPDSYKFQNCCSRPLDEVLIDLPLNPDAADSLVPVALNLFDSRDDAIASSDALVSSDRSVVSNSNSPFVSFLQPNNEIPMPIPDKATVSDKGLWTENVEAFNTNTSPLSSFSFSLPNQESAKSSPISFQVKTPTFSFKPVEGSSSIFGGSFSSPLGNLASSATPSPFVSPFGQQQPALNTSATPLTFTWPSSVAQDSTIGSSSAEIKNEGSTERREEDEYEDVDDEEEDCMFEEDAHIFIKENADSAEEFVDKGEGVVRVMYDGESYCARLVIAVNGENIAEHLVAVETVLEASGDRTYEWAAICSFDSPVKSRIKATFVDEDAYLSFQTIMADSLEYAEQVGVTEAILLEDPSGY